MAVRALTASPPRQRRLAVVRAAQYLRLRSAATADAHETGLSQRRPTPETKPAWPAPRMWTAQPMLSTGSASPPTVARRPTAHTEERASSMLVISRVRQPLGRGAGARWFNPVAPTIEGPGIRKFWFRGRCFSAEGFDLPGLAECCGGRRTALRSRGARRACDVRVEQASSAGASTTTTGPLPRLIGSTTDSPVHGSGG